MLALMMDRALNLPSILEYAAAYHGEREVVTRTVEGPIHRYGYADALARAKRMANALIALGVKPGDRVGLGFLGGQCNECEFCTSWCKFQFNHAKRDVVLKAW